jgi:hypothetical protein
MFFFAGANITHYAFFGGNEALRRKHLCITKFVADSYLWAFFKALIM